jgi:hypothetical protein
MTSKARLALGVDVTARAILQTLLLSSRQEFVGH